MTFKNSLVGMALLLLVGGTGYFTYNHYVAPVRGCDICGRAAHAEHDATVLMKDGTKVHTCCPRCALHYELHSPGGVAGLQVADREDGGRLDAQKAYYVEGSDDHSCVPVSEAPPREPGVEFSRTYDRCLPSLVAFREESAARTFAAGHGGQFLTYEQAVESVKKR